MFEKLAEDIAYMAQIKLAALAEQMEKKATTSTGHLARKAKALAKQYMRQPHSEMNPTLHFGGTPPSNMALRNVQEFVGTPSSKRTWSTEGSMNDLGKKALETTGKLEKHFNRGIKRSRQATNNIIDAASRVKNVEAIPNINKYRMIANNRGQNNIINNIRNNNTNVPAPAPINRNTEQFTYEPLLPDLARLWAPSDVNAARPQAAKDVQNVWTQYFGLDPVAERISALQ